MKSNLCHELLMPQGSHFSCFAKKSNQKKATPTFALIRDLQRKRRAIRNSLRSNNGPLHRRFHTKSRGRIHGDPVEPKFDRFTMKVQARASASLFPPFFTLATPTGVIVKKTTPWCSASPPFHVTACAPQKCLKVSG